ncbi:MAG TPA: hypothetical protein VMT35_00715 [Ignavibacteriaceae bacterium]|nr:hypothetical protein [Ignavibacteriaceae bacterium]
MKESLVEMSKKIISTVSYLINTGISANLYYDSDKHKKLKTAKSTFDKDVLNFIIGNKTYKLKIVKE